MCGRAFDPRFVFSWPSHQIGVMGAEQAADVLADVKIRQLERDGRTLAAGEIEAIRRPVLESYEREISAYYATSHLFDDGLLDPVDTRNALGIALSASLGAPIGEPRYGVLRL
jgi:3-methylcrotonyl-CoA carboxylase beta subunit